MAAERDHLQEVRQHRRRGRYRSRPARAGDPRRRPEEHRADLASSSRSCPRRRARARSALDEMQGGCFSISNLGGIGGTYFTPIVNAPEVAILGISRARHGAGVRQDGQVRAAVDAAAVAVVRSPGRSTAPTASASCGGWPRRSSSRSCWRCRDRRLASQAGRTVRSRAKPDLPSLRDYVPRTLTSYDSIQLVVVGGGPGGYAAAFLAADLGLSVALVDPEVESRRRLRLSRLHSVEGAAARRQADRRSRDTPRRGASTFGEPKIDLDKLREFKNNVVKRLTSGTGQLVKHRKVQYMQGLADDRRRAHPAREADDRAATRPLQFEHAILATGSRAGDSADAAGRRSAGDGFDRARSICPTFRSRCSSSAAATSGWSWARCTPRSAARSRSSR